ncbi:MAG: hypothetical protein HOW73_34900 [Polyangiaceae bacterium]|nr:hypothetical protein [Polyangiaceae bacterium]
MGTEITWPDDLTFLATVAERYCALPADEIEEAIEHASPADEDAFELIVERLLGSRELISQYEA